jgi:MYXO-CTERM domain-containing protein
MTITRAVLRVAFPALLLLAFTPAVRAQFRFAVTPIGDATQDAKPTAINGSGAVAGTFGGSETAQLFIWTPAAALQPLPQSSGIRRVVALSDAGAVLANDSGGQAWLWQAGQFQLLPGVGVSYDMNASGQIAGSLNSGGVDSPYLFTVAGAQTPLPLAEQLGQGIAIGLNDAGDAVGSAFGSGRQHSVLWRANGTPQLLDIADEGAGRGGIAYAVSDDLWVVGTFNNGRAFVWTPTGGLHDMGDHPGGVGPLFHEALDINNVGHAVGSAEVDPSENRLAFFWTADEGMMDLNALLDESGQGWVLQIAQAINDSDQIVGWGTHDGQPRGFLLTPVPIPEPAALPLLALAAAPRLRRRPPCSKP